MALHYRNKLDKKYRSLLYEDLLNEHQTIDKRKTEYLKIQKQQYESGFRAKKTYQNEKYVLRKFEQYCNDNLGASSSMTQISTRFIIDYVNHLSKQTTRNGFFKANTIRVHFRTLKSFFSFAVRYKWIGENPCVGLGKILPRGTRRESYPHMETVNGFQEWMIILDHLEECLELTDYHYFYYVIWILMKTGMRLGEVRLLSWTAPKSNETSYAQIQKLVGNENYEIKILFKRRKRSIPIESSLMDVIKRIPKNQEYIDPSTGKISTCQKTYLFESPLQPGQPISPGCIQRKFKKMMQQLDLPLTYTPHSLRHGFITMLVRKKIAVPVIGDFVGHSSSQITDRYIHVEKDSLKDLLSSID